MAKEKMLSTVVLIQKLESIKLKYQKQHNRQIPYFKRIIEELKTIFTIADIANIIKNLKFLENNCGKSTKKYSDKEIMPILSLFTVTINFLESQKNNETLAMDFKKIYEYDLRNVLTTSEDKLFLDSQTNLTTFETEIVATEKRANSLSDLTTYNVSDKNQDIFKTIQQKVQELKIITDRKNQICEEVNNFDLNFSKEKQLARKWWHWPLKFLTCGIWESSQIKAINQKYNRENFNKLNVVIVKDLILKLNY